MLRQIQKIIKVTAHEAMKNITHRRIHPTQQIHTVLRQRPKPPKLNHRLQRTITLEQVSTGFVRHIVTRGRSHFRNTTQHNKTHRRHVRKQTRHGRVRFFPQHLLETVRHMRLVHNAQATALALFQTRDHLLGKTVPIQNSNPKLLAQPHSHLRHLLLNGRRGQPHVTISLFPNQAHETRKILELPRIFVRRNHLRQPKHQTKNTPVPHRALPHRPRAFTPRVLQRELPTLVQPLQDFLPRMP